MCTTRKTRTEVGNQWPLSSAATLPYPNRILYFRRWRWMQRVLSFVLFEPYFIEPLLRGTWLLNLWLNMMGADVSMGSLILGKVSDHGLVKVRKEKDRPTNPLNVCRSPLSWVCRVPTDLPKHLQKCTSGLNSKLGAVVGRTPHCIFTCSYALPVCSLVKLTDNVFTCVFLVRVFVFSPSHC